MALARGPDDVDPMPRKDSRANTPASPPPQAIYWPALVEYCGGDEATAVNISSGLVKGLKKHFTQIAADG